MAALKKEHLSYPFAHPLEKQLSFFTVHFKSCLRAEQKPRWGFLPVYGIVWILDLLHAEKLDYRTDLPAALGLAAPPLCFPAFLNIFFAAVWANAVIRLLDPVAKL